MGATRNKYFYTVEITLTTAAGGGAAVSTAPAKPIGSFPFIWEELGGYWDESNGDWQVRISDNGANQFFGADQFPVACLLGNADREPYVLKTPWRFEAGSAIMVEAINNGSAGDTLYLLFIGHRLPSAVA